MLTHIYPHKPVRKIDVTICNHQADIHFICGLTSDLVIRKFRKSMVIHDTKYPYWDQVSLNNTNQTYNDTILSILFQFNTVRADHSPGPAYLGVAASSVRGWWVSTQHSGSTDSCSLVLGDRRHALSHQALHNISRIRHCRVSASC